MHTHTHTVEQVLQAVTLFPISKSDKDNEARPFPRSFISNVTHFTLYFYSLTFDFVFL